MKAFLIEYTKGNIEGYEIIEASSRDKALAIFGSKHIGDTIGPGSIYELEVGVDKVIKSATKLEEFNQIRLTQPDLEEIDKFKINTSLDKKELKNQMRQLKALENKLKVYKWSLQIAIAQKE